MSQLFKNSASALLNEDLLSTDLTITLAPGEGDRFPQPDNSNDDSFALLTLEDVSGNIEVVRMPERNGDVLTIERAQENTAALGFATGSRVECRLTAGTLAGFKQVTDQYSLRGDTINSDGTRFWHQTDPGAYQFYTIRFYDLDILGVPVMHIEPPPAITGLNILATIIDAEGNQRGIRLGEDHLNEAPAPSTGKVQFDVPGTLRLRAIDTVSTRDDMYFMWDTYEEAVENEYRFLAEASTGIACRYQFNTRDTNGTDSSIIFAEDGSITFNSYALFTNPSKSVYANAQDVECHYDVDPSYPNSRDKMVWRSVADTNERALWYTFQTIREDTSGDPSTFHEENIHIINGEVRVDKDPMTDDSLVRKSYVDAAAGGYGRTVLWNNDAGVEGPSTTITLDGGKAFSDFYAIEVTAFEGTNSRYTSVTLDTQTMIDKGYGGVQWQIMTDPAGGDETRAVFLRPESDTTFTVQKLGTGTMKLTRVIGKFPKPA